jgi:glycosyltransferase involved in cell wall biosynthesis
VRLEDSAVKILIVSPTPTHPVTAGNRARVGSLVRALQRLGHELHFALGTLAEPDLAAMRELLGERLHVLRCRRPYSIGGFLPRVRRKLLKMIGSEAAYLWSLDDHYDPGLSPQIAQLCSREAFDAVIVEYVFMSKAFEAVPKGAIKILDTHDRFALRHRTFLEAGQAPQWFSTSVAEENQGFRRADYVLAIQEQEARTFVEQLGGQGPEVITVGHLLDTQERIVPATVPHAVFLASGNPINVDAARYFISSVLPLVRRAQPDFRLLLAGDVGAEFGNGQTGKPEAVTCLGRVAAVNDAFRQGALAVNPVRMGTGLNIKMLEALACGIPCVSSEAGSRGLEQYRGKAFLAVRDDDPAAMAEAILSLLSDRERATALGDAGYRLAEEWNRAQLAGLLTVLAIGSVDVCSKAGSRQPAKVTPFAGGNEAAV